MFFVYLQWMIAKAELITTQMTPREDMYGILVPLASRDSNK